MPPTLRDCAAGYLAGMIDGEGCVSSQRPARRVSICSTERDIIDAVARACEILGIDYRIHPVSAKPAMNGRTARSMRYDLNIYRRESLEKLVKLPLGSERKKNRLIELLSSYTRPRAPKREHLVDLYSRGLTLAEIAGELDVAKETVRKWMKRKGIKRRPHGFSVDAAVRAARAKHAAEKRWSTRVS